MAFTIELELKSGRKSTSEREFRFEAMEVFYALARQSETATVEITENRTGRMLAFVNNRLEP